jgi:RNA polymerase sigma-70 factor (ECF subfamily)
MPLLITIAIRNRQRHERTLKCFQLPDELPDDDMVSELFPSVRAMVNSLPELDQPALILTSYQGLTQKELSARLDLSFSGAKSRVQRAREKLKQLLLDCCHFAFDRLGRVMDDQPRCAGLCSEIVPGKRRGEVRCLKRFASFPKEQRLQR